MLSKPAIAPIDEPANKPNQPKDKFFDKSYLPFCKDYLI